MKYQEEIGKIYDTLFFCVTYFNKQAVKEVIIDNYDDTSFMVECYNEVEESVQYLPQILNPLFLYRNQKPTVMSDIFAKFIDFQNDNLDTFLNRLTEKSDYIYEKAFSSLLPGVSVPSGENVTDFPTTEAYIEALNSSDYTEDFKMQIALMFGNFDYVISLLVKHMRMIYQAVNELHRKHHKKLSEMFEQISSERNIKLYNQVFNINVDNYADNSYGTVVLLNQFISLFIIKGKVLELLVGLRHEEDLIYRFNEQSIDLDQLLISIGNGTRLSIMRLLMEHGELNASIIAKITDLPLTTVLRHIKILYDSRVIFISQKNGLQIFYKLNYNMLTTAIKKISNIIGELSDEQTNKMDFPNN